jgi:hypothetical protein|tara:strand:- start:928 stop:1191 length:264 start_codon:yes stop_codon:yes gene_type:complete
LKETVKKESLVMTNFRMILAALRTAKAGAKLRTDMGGSTGDNAFADCVNDQVDDLCAALGMSHLDIRWDDHKAIFFRLRGAFWRTIG